MNPTATAQYRQPSLRGHRALAGRPHPAWYSMFGTRVMNRLTSRALLGLALGLIAAIAAPSAAAATASAHFGVSVRVVYHCKIQTNLSTDQQTVQLVMRDCPSHPQVSSNDFTSSGRRVLSQPASTAYTMREASIRSMPGIKYIEINF